MNGLLPNMPDEGWPGVWGIPGLGDEYGVLGEDGLDGMLGVEKLRLPRLPMEPPLPARAQALDSMKPARHKNNNVDKTIPAKTIFFIIFILHPPRDSSKTSVQFETKPTPDLKSLAQAHYHKQLPCDLTRLKGRNYLD
jgi:hypothetical protein